MLLLTWLACFRPATLASIESPADHHAELPLVVAVHGLGDRPESLLALVQSCALPVRIVAPRGPHPTENGGYSWYDVGFGPDGAARRDTDGLLTSADRLAALIGELANSRPTVGKPVITGFSQGGILSFAVALRHPEAVGTAVPIAGTLPPGLIPRPPSGPVIHAIHGREDPVVPLPESLVAELASAGWTADLTVFDDTEHTVSEPMRQAACRAIAEAAR